MKKIITLALLMLFFSCKEKSVKEQSTISLKNFDDFSEELSNFQKTQNQKIKEYNKSVKSNQELIILNFPFETNDKYDVLVYWDNELIYQKSLGKLKKLTIPTNRFTIPTISIISNSKVYHLGTKGGFDADTSAKYYYLVFCPTNDKDYMFDIIPSNSTLE
jgi:hypothetical protein